MSGTALSLALAVSTALAWATPVLQADCAVDENHYSWEINLSAEPDYWIQFSWNSDYSSPWAVNFGSSGAHDFDTSRGGSTLYARWLHDTAKKTSAAANGELCFQPSPSEEPTPTPEESVSEEPTPTPQESVSEKPTPTPEESVSEEPTPTPQESVSEEPTPTPEESVSEEPTPTPQESVSEEPTPTPEGSVAGGTGTPAPSLPNTAIGSDQVTNLPVSLPVAFLLLVLVGAGALYLVESRRR